MKKSRQEIPASGVKKIALFLFVTLFCANITQAQPDETKELSKNSISFDTGIIPGVHALINYERQIHSAKKVTWYGRAGFGFAGIIFGEGGPGGLGAITMLTGKRKGHFELTIGAFTGKDSDTNNPFTYPVFDIGYRHQKPDGGFMFKAKAGILGIGIGLGYAF